MKKFNYLLKLVQSLSVKEQKRLRKFISNYPRKRKRLNQVVDFFIQSKISESTDEDKLIERLSMELYGQKGKQKILRNWLNDHAQPVIEEFIAATQLKKDRNIQLYALLNYMEDRVLHSDYFDLLKYQIEFFDNQENINIEHRADLFFLNYKSYFHPLVDKYKTKAVEKLLISNQKLDEFIVIAKLRMACELHSQEKISKNKYKDPLTDSIIKSASTFIAQNPVAQVYHNVYRALNQVEITSYQEAIDSFKKNRKYFNLAEQMDILILCINVLNIQLNKTNDDALKKTLHELHKIILEPNLLEYQKKIDINTFIAIVQIGFVVRGKKWVEDFIEHHQQYLPIDFKSDIVDLCNGIVLLRDEQYADAVKNFLTLGKNNEIFQMITIHFLIQCYFEDNFIKNNDKDDLQKTYKRLKQLLDEKYKLTNERLLIYENFLFYVRKLSHSYSNPDNLLKEIIEKDNIGSKSWLIEQCEMVKKKRQSSKFR